MIEVGYGDLLPATDGARLFTTVYLLFALIIAGMAISQIMDQVLSCAHACFVSISGLHIFL